MGSGAAPNEAAPTPFLLAIPRFGVFKQDDFQFQAALGFGFILGADEVADHHESAIAQKEQAIGFRAALNSESHFALKPAGAVKFIEPDEHVLGKILLTGAMPSGRQRTRLISGSLGMASQM